MKTLRLGTRGSRLALAQTGEVAARLMTLHPGLTIERVVIQTTGDIHLDANLASPSPLAKGLFTKELEAALVSGSIDAAVHSLKDLPVDLPPGLVLAAIPERADDGDCLVSKLPGGLRKLPPGAIVATSSPRRRNQLLHLRRDIQVVEIRGNIDTRLEKLLRANDWQALVVAAAAIQRLGEASIPEGLHVTRIEELLPAPGQGAIGIECLESNEKIRLVLSGLHHHPTAECVRAERAVLKSLGGGCAMPLGVRARMANGQLDVQAALFLPDGVRLIAPAE